MSLFRLLNYLYGDLLFLITIPFTLVVGWLVVRRRLARYSSLANLVTGVALLVFAIGGIFHWVVDPGEDIPSRPPGPPAGFSWPNGGPKRVPGTDQRLDDAMRQLAKGWIAFNPPPEMSVGKTEIVHVRVARAILDDMIVGLHGSGKPVTAELLVGPNMGVQLTGTQGFFQISLKNGDEKKLISKRQATDWIFEVQPMQAGTATLYLTVYVVIEIQHDPRPLESTVFVRDIVVNTASLSGTPLNAPASVPVLRPVPPGQAANISSGSPAAAQPGGQPNGDKMEQQPMQSPPPTNSPLQEVAPLASWIFGSILLLFLIFVVFIFKEPTSFQKGIIRFFMALVAAFFAVFFVGGVLLKGTVFGFTISATGGVALFVLIQFLYDPFKPQSQPSGSITPAKTSTPESERMKAKASDQKTKPPKGK